MKTSGQGWFTVFSSGTMIEFVREIQVEWYLETPAPFCSCAMYWQYATEGPDSFPQHTTRRTALSSLDGKCSCHTNSEKKGCRVRGGEGYFDFHSCADAENVEKRGGGGVQKDWRRRRGEGEPRRCSWPIGAACCLSVGFRYVEALSFVGFREISQFAVIYEAVPSTGDGEH